MTPHVLITNDDGIDSFFLRVLVEAHAPSFRVSVAAPLREQSWTGRSFSRLRDVAVQRRGALHGAADAWAIDGSPSDCVNIALGNLLGDAARPDVVIAGINIGYNVTMPLCLSSGTLAGAIEGAAWGLPAIAYSLELPDSEYLFAQKNNGAIEGIGRESLLCAAARAARFTQEILAAAQAAKNSAEPETGVIVHNINFPRICRADTACEATTPAPVRLGSLYREIAPATYRFAWKRGEPQTRLGTDLDCLHRGNISHTVLRY